MNQSADYPRFRWLILISAVLGHITQTDGAHRPESRA